MITDAQLMFSEAQALTATAVSTNVIDLRKDVDIGLTRELYVAVVVGVAADFTSANETYTVQLQTDDNVGFASAANIGEVFAFDTAAKRAAGYVALLKVPTENEQYLRLNYTLGGTTPSITVSAYLLEGKDARRIYPGGFVVQ